MRGWRVPRCGWPSGSVAGRKPERMPDRTGEMRPARCDIEVDGLADNGEFSRLMAGVLASLGALALMADRRRLV